MVKVSVIIPVYNGELYLRQCLDSVCGQTLKEIEIICVDDGSTDSSYDILQEYMKKDERIHVFQQKNLYAGSARNLGKKNAVGEYLVFWDCDDFFAPNALEMMYDRITKTKAEVCICGANHYFQEQDKIVPMPGYLNIKRLPEEEVFNRHNCEKYLMNITSAVPWNKMFSREYIERIHLDFQAVRNGNDIYFIMNAIGLAERIVAVNEPLVTYRRVQSQSLLGTLSKSPLTPLQAWVDVAENLSKHHALLEQSFANKAVSSVFYLLRNMKEKQAFESAVEFLQNGGLERLHIRQYDEEYFYEKWQPEFVDHLIHDTADELHMFLYNYTYSKFVENSAQLRLKKDEIRALKEERKELKSKVQKLRADREKLRADREKLRADREKLRADRDKLRVDNDKLRHSWAYRIGMIIVWLPGKIKNLFK